MKTLESTEVALDTSLPPTRFFCDTTAGTWRDVHYLRYYEYSELYIRVQPCLHAS